MKALVAAHERKPFLIYRASSLIPSGEHNTSRFHLVLLCSAATHVPDDGRRKKNVHPSADSSRPGARRQKAVSQISAALVQPS